MSDPSGIIVVLGAELHAVLEKRVDQKTVKDLAQHPQKVASAAEQVTAHRRAQQFDQREGTNLAHNRQASVAPGQPQPSTESDPDSKSTVDRSTGGYAAIRPRESPTGAS